jgi:hypothetical protein
MRQSKDYKTRGQGEHKTAKEPGQLSRYSDGLGLVRFPTVQGFLFSTASRPTLGLTQTPIQWVPGALSTGIKWQEREADHSPAPSADVKNGGAIPPLPHTTSWIGA